MEIFRQCKLVIKIINRTVLNKLQSYSQISALGQEGHCTSHFKRAMCISCRRMRTGVKNPIFVDVINGWPLNLELSGTLQDVFI